MFIILVKVMILKDDKLLVLKRSPHDSFLGKWDFLGGNLEPGENIEATIYREAKEEANLDIKNIKLFDVSAVKNAVVIIYQTNNFKGEVKIDLKEHSEFKWINPLELNKNNLNPVLLPSINKFKFS
jgi:8-oxo-dGTP diphosphatase